MGGIADKAVEVGTLGAVETDFSGEEAGKRAAKASRQAAETQAQAQQNALNYMREREELPQQVREGALTQMAGLYGLEGGDPNAYQNLQETGAYKSTMGNLENQEEAILRNQSATGALRTGGTDQMLAENQRQTQMQAYQNALGGLQGLGQLPTNTGQIASTMAGIGKTRAQGQLGAAQGMAQARQQGMNNLMGLGQMGMSAMGAFCDPALKADAEKIGTACGYTIYRWIWNKAANDIGLYGEAEGPMADEVERFEPERIEYRQGYKYIKPAHTEIEA